eukprot:m.73221 g.73221  ORF g.73221 m.73221 type:complete len:638 (+) comp8824_c0_seq1:261-2174(+)
MYEEPSTTSKEALYATLTKRISKEVERDSIDCGGGCIGSGQFGQVFRGTYTNALGGKVNVAVKMCKPESGTQEIVEFLREAAIMGQFDHPHIIQIFGYVTLSNPPMIAIELADCAMSDRIQKRKCPNFLLIGWAHEVSTAMCYLSKRGFIHRDLAVRNILLVEGVAKLSDFGRSRRLSSVDEVYAAGNALVPVRWTAPEALAKGMYSSASDVWSFGIVLYEMWTRGAMPYDPVWSNAEVYEKLEGGWRLGPPVGCPKDVYKLMMASWHPDPAERPSFVSVESDIKTARHSKTAMADVHNGEPEPAQFRYEMKQRKVVDNLETPAASQLLVPSEHQQRICYTPDIVVRHTPNSPSSVTYSVPDKRTPAHNGHHRESLASTPDYAVPDKRRSSDTSADGPDYAVPADAVLGAAGHTPLTSPLASPLASPLPTNSNPTTSHPPSPSPTGQQTELTCSKSAAPAVVVVVDNDYAVPCDSVDPSETGSNVTGSSDYDFPQDAVGPGRAHTTTPGGSGGGGDHPTTTPAPPSKSGSTPPSREGSKGSGSGSDGQTPTPTGSEGSAEILGLDKVPNNKNLGVAQINVHQSAKLAKRTSKWVSEWNDRKSERPKATSPLGGNEPAAPPPKSRGFLRSKFKGKQRS